MSEGLGGQEALSNELRLLITHYALEWRLEESSTSSKRRSALAAVLAATAPDPKYSDSESG